MYVPETIDPVIGIASCKSDLVDTTSSLLSVLNVVAIFYPSYAGDLTNLIGMSNRYPVVTPVILTVESRNLTLLIVPPLAPGKLTVVPRRVNK